MSKRSLYVLHISLNDDAFPCMAITFKMVHQWNSFNIFTPITHNLLIINIQTNNLGSKVSFFEK